MISTSLYMNTTNNKKGKDKMIQKKHLVKSKKVGELDLKMHVIWSIRYGGDVVDGECGLL